MVLYTIPTFPTLTHGYIPADVDDGHGDAEEDEEGDSEVCHEEQRYEDDGGEGQRQVPQQLLGYDLKWF